MRVYVAADIPLPSPQEAKLALDALTDYIRFCVAAVPDAIQMPIERYLPPVVLQQLEDIYPRDKLIKILTWIVLHPDDGTVVDNIEALGVRGSAGDPYVVRERSYLYALKFIIRLTGRDRRN
jgi:hypothetical protein